MMTKIVKIAIVGGSGYAGVELLRLLATHPHAQVVAVTSRQEAGRPVAEAFPNLRGVYALDFTNPSARELGQMADLVFFATPHGAAMAAVPEVLEQGARVVDISADFRLRDAEQWSHWYGQPHTAADYLAEAVYGLPEFAAAKLPAARLVAVPGCYPTAVQLALWPALAQRLVGPESIIADCKSGVTGAGRALKLGSLFAEAADNFQAYAAAGHRHQPEIDQALSDLADGPVDCHFQPHLLPQIRGIHASVYARLTDPECDVQELFEKHYRDARFVDVMPIGSHPQTRSVRGSNIARIAVHQRGRMLSIFCVIDNLVRGASGQAVQCMNLMFGLPEESGLQVPPLLP